MNYKRVFIDKAYVFITIVTAKRRKILIKNIDILRDSFRLTIERFNYKIHAICILPDHIHMVIEPYDITDYPKIIQQLKRYFSQKVDRTLIESYSLSESKIKRNECDIWQHRYWEHTITNLEDLYRHIDYIHYNPIKHNYVDIIKDWKYSSFNKFVKQNYYNENWANANDKYKINDLDFE